MQAKGAGLLAIWSTVTREFETDYLHWLTREHIFERVGVPGFRSGRAYRRAIVSGVNGADAAEFAIVYELDHADVMSSEAYRARLDEPTPWTQRIMPKLGGFRRGGGSVVARAGNTAAFGARLGVLRFAEALPACCEGETAQPRLDAIAAVDRVTGVTLMRVASDATGIVTREKSMRNGEEGAFAGAMLIESLDQTSMHAAIEVAAQIGVAAEDFGVYELVFAFDRH
ncbi:hypothetical protein FAZ98_30700 [Paraburkholderia acidisoli]|uniref:Uncharacterized protein n=2 Tax=Paraburkholderia acidisoli TaxID=2571748 RepID=A0A7Z2JL10_9BURK|nr:hypothetical protein FAZ98_30700 [Paraburkholderia acidisoli]